MIGSEKFGLKSRLDVLLERFARSEPAQRGSKPGLVFEGVVADGL